MPITYKARQGDSIPRIAQEHGHAWESVWNHANNASLKAKRKNPNILSPGDSVFIPDKELKEESASTAQKHRFCKAGGLKLRIVLKDFAGDPLADKDYQLELAGRSYAGTTDGEGLLEQEIPAGAEAGVILVEGMALPLRIGHLDPVDEVTGWQARLFNLGYYHGPVGGGSTAGGAQDNPRLQAAVRQFQAEHGLKVDGVVGSITRAKLAEIHGC